jgi:transcriptional regulator with XRE-family HTH domain
MHSRERIKTGTLAGMREIAPADRRLRKLLGRRVERLREERGWTQTELMRRLGDEVRTRVIRVEKGEASPTLTQVEELAKVFGMTPIEFLTMGEEAIWPEKDVEEQLKMARQRAVEAYEAELTWVRERFAEGYLAHLQDHIGVLLKQLAELGQRLLVLQHEATVDNLNRALAAQKRPATFVRAPRKASRQLTREDGEARFKRASNR